MRIRRASTGFSCEARAWGRGKGNDAKEAQ